MPKSGMVRADLKKLQRKWLRGRYEEGRNVAVIVGSPEGCAILVDPDVWEEPFQFRPPLSIDRAAGFIECEVS